MPEFAHPFAGNNLDRKLTHDELIRAVRFSIAAEFEAIQLYMQIAEASDNEIAKAVMVDVANEEREHVGEFYRLLIELEPKEQEFYDEGREEVEEMMEKLKGSK
ncbi:MAG: rubrerythrin [Methanomicrobiaceae archaeon]|uniref:Ferritin-like di-iron-carboxylate protein n=1 Tax=hydrocarbon metagenome TaxID=938273 RepID=A0A0W8FI24_9ZZZZ|nr:rubrerythrin [Methanomicrobiaceae archaeon]MDD5418705.1 ferritin family protein [Methanomicrobiaceae archaeon]